ncbi:MAG: cupin domain-containing protein [Pirellulaceae bacterium]
MPSLLENLPDSLPEEIHETLASGGAFRIDRIVSTGHASEADSWYDQDQAEWLVVLQGEAILQFDDEAELTHLKSGDCVNIPARRRHRVHWTSDQQPTVWLAIYFNS